MPTKIARAAAAGLAAGAALAVPVTRAAAHGAPVTRAAAHGAPVTPISRTAACAAGGTRVTAPACRAARAATPGGLGAYDNLRRAGVGGADRARVPDGRLCSGGLDAYRGLDLARADFPATAVRSGQRLTIDYRATIPHRGSFQIYLTRPDYTPARPLTWAALDPLREVADPPARDGAYRMAVSLPQRAGRHLLYVVWRTSSTPDTYYSCSDLVFAPAAGPSPSVAAAPLPEPIEAPAAAREAARAVELTPAAADSRMALGRLLIGASVALVVLAAAAAGVGGWRRRREGR